MAFRVNPSAASGSKTELVLYYKHGGGRGIRTLAATFGHPTGLAIPPLQPLGYPTIVYVCGLYENFC